MDLFYKFGPEKPFQNYNFPLSPLPLCRKSRVLFTFFCLNLRILMDSTVCGFLKAHNGIFFSLFQTFFFFDERKSQLNYPEYVCEK